MIVTVPPADKVGRRDRGLDSMDVRIACLARRSILRASAAPAAAIVMLLAFSSGATAQTLVDPNPSAKPPSHVTAKSRPAAHEKSCSAYGAGFVNVPGTDTCVKIGGWVSVEGSAGR